MGIVAQSPECPGAAVETGGLGDQEKEPVASPDPDPAHRTRTHTLMLRPQWSETARPLP